MTAVTRFVLPARKFELEFETAKVTQLLQAEVKEWGPEASPEQVQMLAALTASPAEMSLPYREEATFVLYAARLLEAGSGRALCAKCARWYGVSELDKVSSTTPYRPLSGGAGRQWFCPRRHVAFEIVDMRS